MKHFKKITTAVVAGALSLTMGVIALAGCAGGKDYTFEAEDALQEGLKASSGTTAIVETDVPYKVDGKLVEDATISGVGNFDTVGQKMTWTVVSASATSATLTIHAASACMTMSQEFMGILEMDISKTEAFKLTVNGTAVTLSGKLPGTTFESFEAMAEPGTWWNLGTLTGKADLKEGENVIVLEVVGAYEGAKNSGLNVDKLVINSGAELTPKA